MNIEELPIILKERYFNYINSKYPPFIKCHDDLYGNYILTPVLMLCFDNYYDGISREEYRILTNSMFSALEDFKKIAGTWDFHIIKKKSDSIDDFDVAIVYIADLNDNKDWYKINGEFMYQYLKKCKHKNMNEKPKLQFILEYNDYTAHLDNLKYYQNEYVKNRHEGADFCTVMREPKIRIYGKHKTDNSKSEKGEPHFHIFGEFGETEFYFNVKPFSITYKDGFKMLEQDVEKLHNKLLTECEIVEGATYYSVIYSTWSIENKNNS